jgi:hypothetical protein
MKLNGAIWEKSSYSGSDGGQCVEFSRTFVIPSGVVPVRDSKNPDEAPLTFSAGEWQMFIDAVKSGEITV